MLHINSEMSTMSINNKNLDNSKDGNSSTSAALFSAVVEKEAFNASEVKIKLSTSLIKGRDNLFQY